MILREYHWACMHLLGRVERILRARALVCHRLPCTPKRFLTHCPFPYPQLPSEVLFLLCVPLTPLLPPSLVKSGLIFPRHPQLRVPSRYLPDTEDTKEEKAVL